MQTSIHSIDQQDADRRAEYLAQEFKLEHQGSPIAVIPLTYRGEEIKSPKELGLGELVYDLSGGMRKLCRVVKRYRYSVMLELVNGCGRYGQSLHQLRRAE
jgi:hypothetical protein